MKVQNKDQKKAETEHVRRRQSLRESAGCIPSLFLQTAGSKFSTEINLIMA